MPAPAKLTRPKLHRVVHRERLAAALERGRCAPLTWVCGPAGSGKSAAVASYLSHSSARSVWYQIDAGDSDPATFFHYLKLAAEPLRGQHPAPPALTPEYFADLAAFVRHFFATLFECLGKPAVLVFDNYHELAAESPLHALLALAVGQVPEDVQVLVISRAAPPAELAGSVAGGEPRCVDFDDLRLTLAEAREVAALRHGVDESTLVALHRQCDGWAAGFTMMLEHLRRRSASDLQGSEEVSAATFDYFASQILNNLATPQQDFLLRVAVTPHMTAAMAEAVSEVAESAEFLEAFFVRRLFTERRGDTYQFHDLFRAFLRRCADERLAPEVRCAVWRRAAAVLDQAGYSDAAFELLRQAQDWRTAADVLLRLAPLLLEQGRSGSLRESIGSLPKRTLAEYPWLDYWLGLSLMESRPGQARPALQRSIDGFRASGDFIGQMSATAAYVQSFAHELSELSPLDEWMEVLYALWEAAAEPPPGVEMQCCAALLYALTHRRPEGERLEKLARRIVELLDRALPANAKLAGAHALLTYYGQAGLIGAGKRLLENLDSVVEFDKIAPCRRALFLIVVGFFKFIAGDLSGSSAAARESLEIARANAIELPLLHVFGLAGIATHEAGFGDLDEARRLLAEAEHYVDRSHAPVEGIVARAHYLVACRNRDWPAAAHFAQLSLDMSNRRGWVWAMVTSGIARALALSEMDRPEEASETLQRAKSHLSGTVLVRYRGLLRLHEAYLAYRSGAEAAALVDLAEAFDWMRQDEVLFPIHLPDSAPAFLCRALDAGVAIESIRALIGRYRIRPPSAAPDNWPWPVEIRTLGGFDLRRFGEPLQLGRKVPKRPIEMLKTLIAMGRSGVDQEVLADALWPKLAGDEALDALGATLSRLRKLLGEADCVRLVGGHLSLHPAICRVDAYCFEQLLDQADAADPHEAVVDRALRLYCGEFLDDDLGNQWAMSLRERLRRRFVQTALKRARVMEANGEVRAALALYERGAAADAFAEEFYRGQMRCHAASGHRDAAAAVFVRLR